jgi:Ferritin-like
LRSRINRHLEHDFDWWTTDWTRPKPRPIRRRITEHRTPYPPSEFSWPDYVVYLLHVAAEIEHSLMVQYLYAAYSLGGPQVPAAHMEDTRQWQEIILGVAKEEMGHLMTVQNVLILLGAAPSLDRQDYPFDSEFYPFTFNLRPLTLGSLATYICAESPSPWRTKEATAIKARARVAAGANVNGVGRLYARLIDILNDQGRIPDTAFQASTRDRQASWHEWGRGYTAGLSGQETGNVRGAKAAELIVWQCDSRDSAVAALSEIGEQGEALHHIQAEATFGRGPSVSDEKSHFRRFLGIYHQMDKLGGRRNLTRNLAENPHTSPVLDIARNKKGHAPAPAIALNRAKPTTQVITHRRALRWAHLFNLRYRMLLVNLTHVLQHPGSAANGESAKRGYLINRTFGEMYNLRAISGRLVQLPIQAGANQNVLAGPPFEMPYSLRLPDGELDRWRLQRDLYKAAQFEIERMKKELPSRGEEAVQGRQYLDSLAQSDEWALREIEKWILSATPLSSSTVPM